MLRKQNANPKWLLMLLWSLRKTLKADVSLQDGKVVLPPEVVAGSICHYSPASGLDVLTCNIESNHSFKLDRVPTVNKDFFVILVCCSPSSLEYKVNLKRYLMGGASSSGILWYPSTAKVSYKIQAGVKVKSVAIVVSKIYLSRLMSNIKIPAIPKYTECNANYYVQSFQNSSVNLEQYLVLNDDMQLKLSVEIYKLAKEILNCVNNLDIFENLIVKANALKVLSLFIRGVHHEKNNVEAAHTKAGFQLIEIEQVQRLKTLIEHYEEPDHLTLDYLAKKVGMSKTIMKVKFKKMEGISIYEYYQQVRMNKAKDMLDKKVDSITNIAYSMGFKTVSHFSRLFKRYHGVNASSLLNVSK